MQEHIRKTITDISKKAEEHQTEAHRLDALGHHTNEATYQRTVCYYWRRIAREMEVI
jgi:iron-sulfur cluster repair protein YtfE (RIC family)